MSKTLNLTSAQAVNWSFFSPLTKRPALQIALDQGYLRKNMFFFLLWCFNRRPWESGEEAACGGGSGNNTLLCLLQDSWAEVEMLTLQEEPSFQASSHSENVSCLARILPQTQCFSGFGLPWVQWPCRNYPPWWLPPPYLWPGSPSTDCSSLSSFSPSSLCIQPLNASFTLELTSVHVSLSAFLK